MKRIAVIPAGGVGTRFNSPIPKQYIKVLGKELISYTLKKFQECNLVDEIIIPANKSYFQLLHEIKNKNGFTKISLITEGGKERQDSVYNGLKSKKFDKNDLIIVHDAARPLLSEELLTKAIKSAEKFDSVVVAIKARDTLIKAKADVIDYVDRKNIFYAQTPQIFRNSILIRSFEKAIKESFIGTDESMLVRRAGFDVKIVEGEILNFKITTKDDLNIFEKLIRN